MDALNKLGINLGLLIAYTANVVLLIIILRAVAYKPILGLLDRRRERIAEGLNNARRAEEALASAESDRQALLDEARAEAQRIISEARSRADDQAKQIVSEAQEEARRLRQKAQEEAAAERDLALADMREQIVSLSIAAAGHLMGKSVDEKTARQTVTAFFTDLPEGVRGMGDYYTVVTAVPLTDAEKKKVTAALGSEAVDFVTDPSILGGVIVRAGGREVDASYAAQLAEMRTRMLS